jgi:hypothetical protein
MRVMSRFVYLSGLLLLTGCGWEKKVSFTEPSGDATIEILEPFPINASGIRVVLKEGGRRAALYDKRADIFFSFADVVWPKDRGSVAVFACLGGATIELAFDRIRREPKPLGPLSHMVAQHIRANYSVPSEISTDAEIFKWACSDGEKQFQARYPESAAR